MWQWLGYKSAKRAVRAESERHTVLQGCARMENVIFFSSHRKKKKVRTAASSQQLNYILPTIKPIPLPPTHRIFLVISQYLVPFATKMCTRTTGEKVLKMST